MTHQYQITGMTCGSCVAKVKSELLKMGDIVSADIQLQMPQATISMSKHIATPVLQAAISKAGSYIISDVITQPVGSVTNSTGEEERSSYWPIFLIFGYITGITVVVQVVKASFSWMQWMSHFMAGFFLVFSFFKLMNLKGFAEGYRSYDIVAKHIPAWAYVYAFLELALGIAFLVEFEPVMVNIVTLIVMGVSAVGVIQSLKRKTPFQCACLGTVIKLPLGKVTLFEDLLMVLMSVIMLISLL